MSSGQAFDVAAVHVSAPSPVEVSSDLVVYPIHDQFFLAWCVKMWSPDRPFAWAVVVDASSGDVLDALNLIAQDVGLGKVYPTDPRKPTVITLLYRLDGNGKLEGQWFDVWNYVAAEAYEADNVFLYDPSDTHFDEVNAYYHVDRIIHDYFIQELGFDDTNLADFLVIVHNGQTDYFEWAPGGGESILYLSDGDTTFTDTAKKDDAIYHEMSHGILFAEGIDRASDRASAIHEGYADYFATSFTNDQMLAEWLTIKPPYHLRIMETDPGTFNDWNYNTVEYYLNTDFH